MTDTFTAFSTLLHLTELRIDNLIILLDRLDEARLGSLGSLQILKLTHLNLPRPYPIEVTFCRIFSGMFPNLQELYVHSHRNYGIELHLGEFGNLRKHKIKYDDFDGFNFVHYKPE